MSIDEMLEVIQAYKDGKQIQARGYIFEKGDEDKWIDVKKPVWDFSQYNYRIKSEPVSIPASIKESLDNLFSGGMDKVEIQNETVFLRCSLGGIMITNDCVRFYCSELKGDLRLNSTDLDAISNLFKLRKHPEFLPTIRDYINPVSIPVTPVELEKVNFVGVKELKTQQIFLINMDSVDEGIKKGTLRFNSNTKCWEDWSEDETN